MKLGYGRAYSYLPVAIKIEFHSVILRVYREQPIKKSKREPITLLDVWLEKKLQNNRKTACE